MPWHGLVLTRMATGGMRDGTVAITEIGLGSTYGTLAIFVAAAALLQVNRSH